MKSPASGWAMGAATRAVFRGQTGTYAGVNFQMKPGLGVAGLAVGDSLRGDLGRTGRFWAKQGGRLFSGRLFSGATLGDANNESTRHTRAERILWNSLKSRSVSSLRFGNVGSRRKRHCREASENPALVPQAPGSLSVVGLTSWGVCGRILIDRLRILN